jgi:hypothetical protein
MNRAFAEELRRRPKRWHEPGPIETGLGPGLLQRLAAWTWF